MIESEGENFEKEEGVFDFFEEEEDTCPGESELEPSEETS